MKTEKLNINIANFGIALLSIILVLLVVYSCNKIENPECVECKQNKNLNKKTLVLNDTVYTASVYYQASTDSRFAVTILSNDDMPNIDHTIDSVLNVCNIDLSQSVEKYFFGLALFYKDELHDALHDFPTGVLLYHTNTSTKRSYATFWERNMNNRFDLKQNLSGITTYVSRTNFYQIDEVCNMNTKEILLFLKRNEMPTKQYRTVFQIKLETETSNPSGTEAPNGSGGSTCSACGAVFNGCCKLDPIGESCDIVPVCTGGQCDMVINTGGYHFKEEDYDYLYWIRDSVLIGSERGQEIIDDYYYSGEIMRGNISFSLAWKLYRLFGIDLFSKFPQFFTSNKYEGEILVNNQVLEITQEMFDEARNISNDERYQSIILNIEKTVDDYNNKPFSYIRNSLK
jgi:hypothetical protein